MLYSRTKAAGIVNLIFYVIMTVIAFIFGFFTDVIRLFQGTQSFSASLVGFGMVWGSIGAVQIVFSALLIAGRTDAVGYKKTSFWKILYVILHFAVIGYLAYRWVSGIHLKASMGLVLLIVFILIVPVIEVSMNVLIIADLVQNAKDVKELEQKA
ncbi:MAG: hypothetical protein LBT20_03790 [Clostridiales bacterium]|jgi:hypothetical protein|nr:hypothetical protein [Clostridiales bacterium]